MRRMHQTEVIAARGTFRGESATCDNDRFDACRRDDRRSADTAVDAVGYNIWLGDYKENSNAAGDKVLAGAAKGWSKCSEPR